MPDQLTGSETSRTAALRAPVLFVVVVVTSYAVVGVVAGWLWHRLWTPSTGVVFGHQWYATGDALREEFSGTGLYVLIAAGAGLVLGVAAAVTGGRRPVLTVVAAVAASALAGWLMLSVGQALGPADPQEVAKTTADQQQLPSALRVSGISPKLAFSFGTLVALAVVYTIFPDRTRQKQG